MLPQKLTKIYSHKIKNQSDIIYRTHLLGNDVFLATTNINATGWNGDYLPRKVVDAMVGLRVRMERRNTRINRATYEGDGIASLIVA